MIINMTFIKMELLKVIKCFKDINAVWNIIYSNIFKEVLFNSYGLFFIAVIRMHTLFATAVQIFCQIFRQRAYLIQAILKVRCN